MSLALVTLVVPDYDAGLAFFVRGLGWALVEDTAQSEAKRWVVVRPGETGAALLLARAASPGQTQAIGRQTGDRVGFFWETEDFEGDLARLTSAGATLLEEPRSEPYGRVVQWQDPWGNRWDLLQRS